MNLHISRETHVAVGRGGSIRRREFLRGVSVAALAAGATPWTDQLAARAEELRSRGRACILLWMQGGPSQFETLNPKPGRETGGETKAIATSVPGIQLAENLPHLAARMDHLALVRSMTTKEGNHQRASYLMHTSYVPTASVKYPAMGSVVSQQIADAACELPAFVRIGARFVNSGGGGLLGAAHDPFVVTSASRPPTNTQPTTDAARYRRRLGLLGQLEGASSATDEALIADHRALYEKTSRMILSSQMEAFKLDAEPATVRNGYGKGEFADGCLLARRLVEAGVPFVEVSLVNWDTHDDNFNRSRALCEQLDGPFAYLLEDLRERGLLDSTLVMWMGEFGRTPRVNPRGGRDHYPRAFSAALAGAGVRGGQVVGSTDDDGTTVTDQPVTEKDLFQTVYHALGIDASHENMSSIGRPIKLVDGGAPVMPLFG